MAMVDRIKGILLAPKSEWPKIAAEPASVQSIYTNWIMILGLIGPVMLLVLTVMVGSLSVIAAVGSYVNTLVGCAIVALIADLIAPTFGGRRDYVAGLKLVAYAATPVWIAQVALIVPILGSLVVLAAMIYAVYLVFLGAPVLAKASSDKAVPFTIALLLCAIVVGYLMMRILFATGAGGPMGLGTPHL